MANSELYKTLAGVFGLAAAGAGFMALVSVAWYMGLSTGHAGSWPVLNVWQWLAIAAACACASGFLSKLQDKASKSEGAARRVADRQNLLQRTIDVLSVDAISLRDSLTAHLSDSTRWLDQAEVDWRERAYNPFWTSVQNCACSLIAFRDAIRDINKSAAKYRDAVAELQHAVPPFPVTSASLAAMKSYDVICARMAALARRAQSDRDFAMIFQMWSGNSILNHSDFDDLQSAIDLMGSRISHEMSLLDTRLV